MRVARLSLFIRFYLQPHLQAEVNYVSASGVQLHTLMVMSSRHYGHLCLLTRIWHSSSDLVLCASLAYRDLFSKAAPYQQEGHAQYSQEASPWRLVPGCDLVNSPGSPACSSFKAPAQVSISQPASQPRLCRSAFAVMRKSRYNESMRQHPGELHSSWASALVALMCNARACKNHSGDWTWRPRSD